MKRLGMFVVAGALLLGVALPTWAQQPPAFTVTFSGEMRVHGLVWDNVTDFADTKGTANKDSESYFFQRWRLWTRVESADKKARAVWAVEVGDITWGSGGGASGAEFGGVTARIGPGTGGGLGNDGVNVETKNLYVQFDIPFVPNANLLLGLHNIVLLSSPTLAFLDDDAAGIQFNWKMDPVDLQIWYAKTDENTRANADDNDMYAARLGVNLTKDVRFTVEGLVMNQQCFARRAPVAPATTGTCVSSDFADTFWVGGTAAVKIGTINLDGTLVYGQRQLFASALNRNVEESGVGVQVTARVPVGPVQTWIHGWYTTGDENRPVGGNCNLVTNSPFCGKLPAGSDLAAEANTTRLTRDSDKLPLPIRGTSWGSAPFVGEYLFGLRTLGAPAFGSPQYLDMTGTYGVGASGIFAVTPAVSVGGGLAFVAPSEDARAGIFADNRESVFGSNLVEIDAGALYTYNPQLSFQLIAGYLIPDKGDDAWGVSFRTRFAF